MSDKKLSDYIQYYIGCRVFITDCNEYGILMGGSFVPSSINQIYYFIRTDEMVANEGDDFDMPYNDDADDPARIKPILRRLEDITDDEWADIEPDIIIPDAWGYYGIRDNFMKRTSPYRFDWAIVNEALIALRKRFVDVDNLIESGLAIDAKTINNKV